MCSRFLVCAHHVRLCLLCIMGSWYLLYGNFSRLTFFTHIHIIVREIRTGIVLVFVFRFVLFLVLVGHRCVCVVRWSWCRVVFGIVVLCFCLPIGVLLWCLVLFWRWFGIRRCSILVGCDVFRMWFHSICILLWGILF